MGRIVQNFPARRSFRASRRNGPHRPVGTVPIARSNGPHGPRKVLNARRNGPHSPAAQPPRSNGPHGPRKVFNARRERTSWPRRNGVPPPRRNGAQPPRSGCGGFFALQTGRGLQLQAVAFDQSIPVLQICLISPLEAQSLIELDRRGHHI